VEGNVADYVLPTVDILALSQTYEQWV